MPGRKWVGRSGFYIFQFFFLFNSNAHFCFSSIDFVSIMEKESLNWLFSLRTLYFFIFVLFCEYLLEDVEKSFQNQSGNCRAGWSGYSEHTGLFFFA